jgi:peptide/nickel transport system permease protein
MKQVPITLTIGAVVTGLLILTAIFAPAIAPCSPIDQDLYAGLAEPSSHFPLGADRLGRDQLSRIIYGSRISLTVGLTAVTVSLLIGTMVGLVAGYLGGIVDEVTMRVVDIFLAFPGILLAIGLMAALGPSVQNVIIALSLMGWTGFARLVRGQTLTLKEREFVIAAESVGAGPVRVMFKHLLPNMVAPLTVEATFGVASAIVAEAGLSFLGLGVQPPTPSWGSMLSEGRQFLLIAPHLILWPGIAIATAVLAINFLGDGLRDYFDPRRLGR